MRTLETRGDEPLPDVEIIEDTTGGPASDTEPD
jgi:hypothetical protein